MRSRGRSTLRALGPIVRLGIALALAQAGFQAYVAALPVALLAAGRPDGEIGAVMGSAAIFNIAASLAAGGLIDRYGGRKVYLAGVLAYTAASGLLLLGIVRPESPTIALLLVRLLQGTGLAAAFPAVLTLVPSLVSPERLPAAIAAVGVASNLSLAVMPALALVVLEAASLSGVAAMTLVSVLLGGLLIAPGVLRAHRAGRDGNGDRGSASTDAGPSRRFRPTWSPAWTAPMAITFLFLVHWGVVTGYLPQRAEAAGADVGLFFASDALALLVLRVPGGYLAGRLGSRPLMIAGILVTTIALVILLAPATTPLLVAGGIGVGAGSALLVPTLMLELTRRSDPANRGSAFALFTVAFSVGIALGSVGVAPFYGLIGFEVALMLGIACCGLAALAAVADGGIRRPVEGTAPA